MPEHVGGHVEHVLRQHVVTAAHQGQPTRGGDHAQRGTRARPVRDPAGDVGHAVLARLPGGQHQPDHVVDQRVVHEDVAGRPLQPQHVRRAEHLVGRRRVDTHPVDDLPLLLAGRVVDHDLHQEPVALRLRERVDTLGLDRVLGGQHQERAGHRVRRAADRHLPLRHDLEQRGLHLRRCPVDLVGEHEVGEHGAELGVEALRAGLEDPGADDVGRDQVRRELQPGEGAAGDRGERLDRERLGDPGHALEQAVAAGEQADEHPLDHPVLPDDDPFDLEERALQQRRILGRGRRPRPARDRRRRLDHPPLRLPSSPAHAENRSCPPVKRTTHPVSTA